MAKSDERRKMFAKGTTALQENLTTPHADAAFDAALTNGLLEVVAAAIPGHPPLKKKHLPSARELLESLETEFGKDAAGITQVPSGEPAHDLGPGGQLVDLGHKRMVPVNVGLLTGALDNVQAARHGRGPAGTLATAHVDALAVLDEHPALRVLSDFRRDQYWDEGPVEDAEEFDRATSYLSLLAPADIAARTVAAEDRHGGGEHELYFCPVCANRALVALGVDSWGYGTVAATCAVCSFQRSEHAMELLNLDEEWEARWADD